MKYRKETKGFERFVKIELLQIGKTNKDLAVQIGVSDACLSNWMKGYVKLETFKDKVISGLNVLKSSIK